MDVSSLLESAIEATGLADFGDPSFRDGLDVLVGSLNDEAELNEIGRPAAEAAVTAALVTRLQVIDHWNHHPELAEQRVQGPVFIVGVSRSGTTALSHLLSVDPANRCLRGWEANAPVPPPRTATYETDPRYLASIEADENSMLHALNPEFKSMHHDPPHMPTECVTIMTQDFVSLQYNAMFNMATYAQFVVDRDHASTYRYHQQVQQLLQSEHPGRWMLKSPHHALCVDTIAQIYPDARFIWPHRDPATCIASTASITRSLSGTFSDAEWSLFEGELWSRVLSEMIERLATARTRLGDRFVDVDYRQLVDDPVGAARQLYADLGDDFSADVEQRMKDHTAEHRQHRYGRHSYTFEEFGIDRAALDERHADYKSTYGC
jgi:hypothetical protein